MDPRAATIFDGQGGVASTLQLMAAGVTATELHSMVRSKEIVRVRRKTLIRATALADVTPWERRAIITRAVGQTLAPAVGVRARDSGPPDPGTAFSATSSDTSASTTSPDTATSPDPGSAFSATSLDNSTSATSLDNSTSATSLDNSTSATSLDTASSPPDRDPGYALSHHSALIIHGLPYFGEDDLVHLCRTDGGRGRRDGTVFIHKLVDGAEVEEVDGLRVVTPVMAALQMAAHFGAEAGLVCLDGVLHRAEVMDREEVGHREGPARTAVQAQIDRALEQSFPRAGKVVREVAELADGGSESAGESRARWLAHLLGFGPLITQFQVRDGRVLLGIADLKLKDHKVLLEFDGQGKYADPSSLYAEKRREDQIRNLGYEVVRLTWDDLAHPARVRQRILAAIARAAERERLGA